MSLAGRYDVSMWRRWILTTLTLMMLALAVLWAILFINIVLYDSYGNYRSPGILGMLECLLLSLSPALACCWAIYRIWFGSRKSDSVDAERERTA
jgi:hypothetical protein